MTIKFIACDLDGTLLNGQGAISARTQAVIKLAQDKGAIFSIATGRMFCSALQFASLLETKGPVISYNGALVKEAVTGQVLRSLPLDLAAAGEVLAYCKEKGWYAQKYENDFLYVHSLTGYAERYSKKVNVPVEAQGEAFYEFVQPPDKLMLVVEPEEQPSILADLKEKFAGKVFITTSNSRFVEIIRPGVNKAAALKFVCSHLGVDSSEVMAIGDSFNDMEMLEYAGVGVAVENADPQVKAISDFVTLSNDNDGVAKAIEKYVL